MIFNIQKWQMIKIDSLLTWERCKFNGKEAFGDKKLSFLKASNLHVSMYNVIIEALKTSALESWKSFYEVPL